MTDYSNLNHEELMALANDMPALSDEDKAAVRERLEELLSQYTRQEEELKSKKATLEAEVENLKQKLAQLRAQEA